MATNVSLAILEKEENLRTVWPNEASDFTPWLAQNINLLNDTLDLNLEVCQTESAVGRFHVDIVAKCHVDGRFAVIENQLEASNHDHLGKLLTYMEGKDADIAIWIVKKARPEHRLAVANLNHNGMGKDFFMIEVELWRVNESILVPNFKVVEHPDRWHENNKTSFRPQEVIAEDANPKKPRNHHQKIKKDAFDMPKIHEGEYRFCLIMWEHEPVTAVELVKHCQEQLGWKKSTTYTIIKRLGERGVLEHNNGMITSLVSKEKAQAYEVDELVEKRFEGSMSALIAALINRQDLSEGDLDDIQRMIDRIRKRGQVIPHT